MFVTHDSQSDTASQSPTSHDAREWECAALDCDSRSYLRSAWTHGDRFPGGILIRLPTKGAAIAAALGAVGLAAAAWLCSPRIAHVNPMLHTALLVAATCTFVLGVRLVARRRRSAYLGDFLLFDSSALWSVNPIRVRRESLPLAPRAKVTHHHSNGSYIGSSIEFALVTGTRRLTGLDQTTSELAARFLNALVWLRTSAEDGPPELVQRNPATAGTIAAALAREDHIVPREALEDARLPPSPLGGTAGRPATHFGLVARWGVASALLGALLLPPLRGYLREEYLYAKAAASQFGFNALDAYISEWPDGRYSDEIRNLRDVRRFSLAEASARRWRDPSGLRDYLGNPENSRHRADAQALIDEFYLEAAEHLRALPSASTAHKEIQAGLLSVLRGLRFSRDSTVPVRFVSPRAPVPPSPSTARAELEAISDYRRTVPELQSLPAASRVAVIDSAGAFTPDQMAFREGIIMERLASAISSVFSSSIILLRRAAATEAAAIEITYEIVSTGEVYVWTQATRLAGLPGVWDGTQRYRGLVREYRIRWMVAVRGEPEGPAYTFQLSSGPASEIKFETEESDSDWGLYAIMLTSATYDLSTQLIEGFGLKAPAHPSPYRLADCVLRR